MWRIVWYVTFLFNGSDGLEPTDRLIPPGWQGNPWGPEATAAREAGTIPPIALTPKMAEWESWGKKVLHDGDLVFRRGDARIAWGHFPFSRFLARVSGSEYSHTGIVSIEKGEPVVYDTTKAGVRRQPFPVWVLDNVGPLGVKRVRPELSVFATKAVQYCLAAFEKQVPFDYNLSISDDELYCVEMTEKAYRTSGLPLSDPLRLGDMENITRFPICIFVFLKISNLDLEQLVYFPGNEKHGIWSSRSLVTVYPPPVAARTANPEPAKPKRAGDTPSPKTAIRSGGNPS